MQWLP